VHLVGFYHKNIRNLMVLRMRAYWPVG